MKVELDKYDLEKFHQALQVYAYEALREDTGKIIQEEFGRLIQSEFRAIAKAKVDEILAGLAVKSFKDNNGDPIKFDLTELIKKSLVSANTAPCRGYNLQAIITQKVEYLLPDILEKLITEDESIFLEITKQIVKPIIANLVHKKLEQYGR